MTAEKDRPVAAMLQGGLDRRSNLRLPVSGLCGAGDELFGELAELVGEAVYGPLDADQKVECHDDGKANAGDCDEEILFHGITFLVR